MSASAWAQQFSASTNANPASVGEPFEISFTIEGAGGRFYPPAFNGLQVVSGPNQSQFTQYVNGKMSQSFTLSYMLVASKAGNYSISPATIEVNGQKIQSNTLNIKVVSSGSQAAQGRGAASAAGTVDDEKVDMGNNLFIKASVDKSNTYKGEALTVTYKLYTRVSINDYVFDKMPSFTGFWSQDIEIPKNQQVKKETINGLLYNVFDIKKVVLFPQYAGKLSIEPLEGQFVVRIQAKEKKKTKSDDIFDQFFNDPFFGGMNYKDVKVRIKSPVLALQVKELPAKAPASFSGAVGNYNFEAFFDKTSTKANEPVTLKIKISGKGNLKLIDAPKINFPKDFEIYDPKSDDNISVNSDGVKGTRTFEYLVIPRYQGDYKIEAIKFSYFDLASKQFVELKSKDFNLKVEKGDATNNLASNGVDKEDISLIGKDIRYIKTETKLKAQNNFFFASIWFYLLLLLPISGMLAALVLLAQNKKLQGNLGLARQKSSTKVALKRLKIAKQQLDIKNKDLFYEAIFQALYGYLSDKLGIQYSALTKENIASHLQQKNVNEGQIAQLMDTLNKCEFARFAPNANAEMDEIYQSTIALISTLEIDLKKA